jgi:hypothetical protein
VTTPGADRPDGPPLPEHEQRVWDAIVADLRGQIDLGPEFPSDPPPDPTPAPVPVEVEEDDVDERYVPPEPPPIPRPADAIGRFSWAAVISGPILILLTTILDLDRWMANLGVVLTVGGFVSLIWRMKDRDDDDDGAVV